MYVGIMVILVGISLLLGSRWAFVPAGFVASSFVTRAAFEDRMPREELPGQGGHVLMRPHRLTHGVW